MGRGALWRGSDCQLFLIGIFLGQVEVGIRHWVLLWQKKITFRKAKGAVTVLIGP
jgi:hypothetical protein